MRDTFILMARSMVLPTLALALALAPCAIQSDVAEAKTKKTKANLGEIKIIKKVDKSSPSLAKRKGGKKQEQYLKIELKNVYVTRSGKQPGSPPKGSQILNNQGILGDGAGLSTRGPSAAGSPAGAPAAPAGRLY
jgi:hypothetical protein